MAYFAQGYINKHNRLAAADAKITQREGQYQKTMFFSKGERRAALSVYEHRLVFDVYADPDYSQHVDWNDPDCRCLDHLGSPTNILYVLSALTEQGFVFTNER